MDKDRKDKIRDAIHRDYKPGDFIKSTKIKDTVEKYYPEVNRQSILPHDFCDNYRNEDPFSGRYPIFHRIEGSSFTVL